MNSYQKEQAEALSMVHFYMASLLVSEVQGLHVAGSTGVV